MGSKNPSVWYLFAIGHGMYNDESSNTANYAGDNERIRADISLKSSLYSTLDNSNPGNVSEDNTIQFTRLTNPASAYYDVNANSLTQIPSGFTENTKFDFRVYGINRAGGKPNYVYIRNASIQSTLQPGKITISFDNSYNESSGRHIQMDFSFESESGNTTTDTGINVSEFVISNYDISYTLISTQSRSYDASNWSHDIGQNKILNYATSGINPGTVNTSAGSTSLRKYNNYLNSAGNRGAILPGSQYRLCKSKNANNSSGGSESDGYGEWSDDYDSGITNLLNVNGILNTSGNNRFVPLISK